MLDFFNNIDWTWFHKLVEAVTELSANIKCPFLWGLTFVVAPAVVVLLLLYCAFGDDDEEKVKK